MSNLFLLQTDPENGASCVLVKIPTALFESYGRPFIFLKFLYYLPFLKFLFDSLIDKIKFK